MPRYQCSSISEYLQYDDDDNFPVMLTLCRDCATQYDNLEFECVAEDDAECEDCGATSEDEV